MCYRLMYDELPYEEIRKFRISPALIPPKSAVLLFWLILIASLFWSFALAAQPGSRSATRAEVDQVTGPMGATLSEALKVNLRTSQRPSLALLRDAGASMGEILVVESLPKAQAVLVEVALTYRTRELRYPIKLEHVPLRASPKGCASGGWKIVWVPDLGYTQGLLNMVVSQTLPRVDAAQAWVDATRVPSLPLLITRQVVVSPFGSVSLETPSSGRDSTLGQNRSRQPTSSQPALLVPPKALVDVFDRWIGEVLEHDHAMASIDILSDHRVSWGALSSVVLAAATRGFFEVFVISEMEPSRLGFAQAFAPIDLPTAIRDQSLLIAASPREKHLALTFIADRQIVAPKSGCVSSGKPSNTTAPRTLERKISLCLRPAGVRDANGRSTDAWDQQLEQFHEQHLQGLAVPLVTLGAGAQATAGQMIPLLQAIHDAFSPKKGRVIWSYIKDSAPN